MRTKKNALRKWTLIASLIVFSLLLTGATGCPNNTTNISDRSSPPPGQNISFESRAQENRKLHLRQGASAFFKNLPQDEYLVSAEELRNMLQEGRCQIIDIREPDEFTQAHIKGAINIPFSELGGRMDELAQDSQIIVVCETGQAAGMATAALNIAEFQSKTLRDGFPAWQRAGYETTSGRENQTGNQTSPPNTR